ncbi:unnamed protein product, partial [Acidithrix sp. C25]
VPQDRQTNFPQDFIWGAATASYQIEGAISEGGRGPSIWDTFSHTPGRVHNDDNGDVACDHFNRYGEDLELISDLGLKAYRFSIAWPRIQPTGKGPLNHEGLDFYRRLVEGLREKGVTPVATLYHWDLPQPLEDAGGWRVRDTSYYFSDYASIVAEALGDSIGSWITLNEPWCSAWLGYGIGVHAPGDQDLAAAVAATHHLLLGHGLAVGAIREHSTSNVGITLNLANIRAASSDEADLTAARLADGNANRIFLDPIFKGAYPNDMAQHYGAIMPEIHEGDLATISTPIDFLGINFYAPSTIASRDRIDQARIAGYLVDDSKAPNLVDRDMGAIGVGRPGVPRTPMRWEVESDALRELLVRVRDDYGRFPIFITENGRANDDYVGSDGSVKDPERIEYVHDHLLAVHQAIESGVDVKGYFLWSLMDNFEWSYGFSKRFGIIWVDYDTGRRVKKDSFHWYKNVISEGGFPK